MNDFNAIWNEYREGVKSFLHSRISDSDEVDDLLQSIFVKVYEKHHTLRAQSSFKSWLFQIANNAIIDHYRKQAKSKDLTKNDLWYEDETNDVITELAQCAEPFIHALPAKWSEPLLAVDIQGKSQKVYAEENGISYSTLKSQVQKARSELQKLFLDCCHFSMDQQGNIADFEPKNGNCKKC